MLFNSFSFLVFFLLFFGAYFFLKGKARLLLCLISSSIFYGWWDWRFLFLIGVSTLFSFFIGGSIYRERSEHRRRLYFLVALGVNIGLLGFFKYYNFFFDTLSQGLASFGFYIRYSALQIALPLGISFYTFHNLSYIIDIYWRKIDLEPSLLRFANFVAIFPHLVAGPIVRAGQLLPQMRRDHPFSWQRIIQGAELVLSGYFMKVVVADSLAPVVDRLLSIPEKETSLSLLIGISFFSFQIYCDFAGYSRIAIGLAKMLGFDFGMNFDRPYFSTDFSDFWRRWHISLSKWFRDYLYIPLGGNAGGILSANRNLAITMLICGLWHGANWTFVAWGALHALFQIVQRILSSILQPLYQPLRMKWPRVVFLIRPVSMLIVFIFVSFAWIFFRSPDFGTAWIIIKGIGEFNSFNFTDVPEKFFIIKGFLLIFAIIVVEALSFSKKFIELTKKNSIRYAYNLLIIWSIPLLGTFKGTSFIYFQF